MDPNPTFWQRMRHIWVKAAKVFKISLFLARLTLLPVVFFFVYRKLKKIETSPLSPGLCTTGEWRTELEVEDSNFNTVMENLLIKLSEVILSFLGGF